MEYANGGEVNNLNYQYMCTCRCDRNICALELCYYISFPWTNQLSPHLSSSPSLSISRFPLAFLPFVKGPGVLRGASTVLWSRDSVSSGLPACRKKRGLSRSKGGWGSTFSLPHPHCQSLSSVFLLSRFPSFLPWQDINRICLHPEQWQWPGPIDPPPPDHSPDLTAAGGSVHKLTAARQK